MENAIFCDNIMVYTLKISNVSKILVHFIFPDFLPKWRHFLQTLPKNTQKIEKKENYPKSLGHFVETIITDPPVQILAFGDLFCQSY